MKKAFPYILFGILVAALILLIISRSGNKDRIPDERISLRRSDKIPYGTYVAFQSLQHFFPAAGISINRSEPYLWDSLSIDKSGQVLLIITPHFFADESEMQRLAEFVRAGNQVLISSRNFSISAQDFMKLRSSVSFGGFENSDSLELNLEKAVFGAPHQFSYPGKKFDTYLFRYDTAITSVLGRSFDHEPNFVMLKAGKGRLYLHLAPLAFSNYFVLHKDNFRYYEKLMSLLPVDAEKVIWDEYFYYKLWNQPESERERKGWLSVMMQFPSLKWGLLTALFALLLFVLMEMRRKQRIIPVIKSPVNDSLDFVKTIGRLYYDKKDHLNLCRKMAAYFLEHIRSRYQLPTGTLDENFVKSLHYKSGYPENELKEIISFISFTESAPAVSDGQLAGFYKKLEEFYKRE